MRTLASTDTVLVFQAGGPTPVINATLAGLASSLKGKNIRLLGVRHNFEARISAELLDLSVLTEEDTERLIHTPGAVLGSSRTPVDDVAMGGMLGLARDANASAIVGIGGDGTLSTLAKVSAAASSRHQPLFVLGLPKTVDNDIPSVHTAPGYGSAARFVALAVRDFDCDFRAMQSFDQVTILETMGRNTGWVAAAGGLLADENSAPHMILVPEAPVDLDDLLQRIAAIQSSVGRAFVVSNEVLFTNDGQILGAADQALPTDRLGRVMYSLGRGVGSFLAENIREKLGLQTRVLRPGNLARAMTCCVSTADRALALQCGQMGAQTLLAGLGSHRGEYLSMDERREFLTRSLTSLPAGKHSLEPDFFDSAKLNITHGFKTYAAPFVSDIPELFNPELITNNPNPKLKGV